MWYMLFLFDVFFPVVLDRIYSCIIPQHVIAKLNPLGAPLVATFFWCQTDLFPLK